MAATSFARFTATPIVRRLAAIVGWLCVIATLALLSPGVVATASADQSAPATGAACKTAERNSEELSIAWSQSIERLGAEAVGHGNDPSDVVPLNTRGYNYVPQPIAPQTAGPQR
jgi:hypothetical protein